MFGIDIAALVQAAGTGGGGGSTSPLTTKGDLWGFTTVDARVPVGADATLLLANSGAAPGIAWTAMSGDATIAVTGALTIANDAITAAKIAAGAVGTSEIANLAVDTAEIANSAVTNVKMANMATGTVKANITGGAAAPTDVSYQSLLDAMPVGTNGHKGVVPDPGVASGLVLSDNMTWIPMAGVDTAVVTASENLVDGDLVNIWSSAGTFKCRKADATSAGKEAHAYVLASVTSGNPATVYFEGTNSHSSGLSPGVLFLSTTPGLVTSTAPTGSGNVVQRIGFAVSSTAFNFQSEVPITLA